MLVALWDARSLHPMNKTSSDLLERSLSALCVLLLQGLIVDEWPPTSRRVTKVEGKALTCTRSEVLFWRGGCEYVDWDRCGAARRTECRSCAATPLVVTWQISPAVLRWHVANQTWSGIKLIYVKAYSASRSSCYGICRRVCFICVCHFKWLPVHACAKKHIEFQLHSCQMKTDVCVVISHASTEGSNIFYTHLDIFIQLFQSSQSGRKNVLLICSYKVFISLLFNH